MAHAVNTLVIADQVVQSLGGALSHGSRNLAVVPGLLGRVLREGLWKERVIKTGEIITFDSFERFVVTPPLEGLGASVRLIRNIIRDDIKTTDLLDQALKHPDGNPTGANQHTGGTVDNIHGSDRPTGTSRDAALRRLRKDRPDLHARVIADELTAHAAMVEAGFRRRLTAFDRLIADWRRATPDERRRFREWQDAEAEA